MAGEGLMAESSNHHLQSVRHMPAASQRTTGSNFPAAHSVHERDRYSRPMRGIAEIVERDTFLPLLVAAWAETWFRLMSTVGRDFSGTRQGGKRMSA